MQCVCLGESVGMCHFLQLTLPTYCDLIKFTYCDLIRPKFCSYISTHTHVNVNYLSSLLSLSSFCSFTLSSLLPCSLLSLLSLLSLPLSRTCYPCQVLIQKEWLWFGHPFHARHARQGKTKEDGPIFLQWVDCVWQVRWPCSLPFSAYCS